ncbi:hypothetical protein [Actinomadura monticuli]|uniref:HIT domain-containing protein n=1 Tax=Actinomadura monticuli TaxID=3097367 RepID=A0ABV4QA64_9ACTN
MRADDTDCFICAAGHCPPELIPWYDRPLIHEPEVGTVIGAVGALVPGYVIVAPIMHTRSIRDLPKGKRSELLRLLDAVRSRIERHYGPATIFEHGSCRELEGRRPACVAHSHVHVVPGKYGLAQTAPQFTAFDSLEGMLAAADSGRGLSYLMFQEPGEPVHFAADPGVSQFFRRHIAAALGEADAWDYAAVPRWDNIRETQRTLAGQSAECSH